MKRLFLLVALGFSFVLPAKTLTLSELFLALPDSVFTKTYCFQTDGDSFTVKERKTMLDSMGLGMSPESGQRFMITQLAESIGVLAFTDAAEHYVTLHLFTGKEQYFCIETKSCDFVMCRQRMQFYTFKGKKLREYKNVLPESYAMRLFFDTTYLAEKGVDPELPIEGVEYFFRDNGQEIYLVINSEFFDAELMGEEHPMTKLDAGRMTRTEIALRRQGFRFVMSN